MTSNENASLATNGIAAGDADGTRRLTKRRLSIPALLIALGLYAVVICPNAIWNRDQINPDAIAYIRHAVYLSQGRWLDSVSGYWSPLLSWSLAPLIYFGLDGLYASRVVLGVWGAVLVIGSSFFVSRCTELDFPWNRLVPILVALAAARWATIVITPDVLLGALLVWYFAFTAKPEVLYRRRIQVLAGIFGGLAYFAKSYAFPFFLAHYPFSLLLHLVLRRTNTSVAQVFKALGYGFLAFSMVAGPWVYLLSYKYGKFTFSTAAALNHYIVGPPEVVDRYHVVYRPQVPLSGRMAIGETPEHLDFKDWSPFASLALFKHQVKHMIWNGERIVRTLSDFDFLALVPGCLFLMPLIRIAAARRGTIELASPYPAAWSLMTIGIYAGGFLPIAFETRYIEPVLWPLCCTLVFGVISDVSQLCRPVLLDKSARSYPALVPVFLSALCALSFVGYSKGTIYRGAGVIRTVLGSGSVPQSAFRQCGKELAASGCRGPVVASERCWHEGLYVSYHASLPFLGEIREKSPREVEQSLQKLGARAFVAHSMWPFYEDFVSNTKWQKLCTTELYGTHAISVFIRPETESTSLNSAVPSTAAGNENRGNR